MCAAQAAGSNPVTPTRKSTPSSLSVPIPAQAAFRCCASGSRLRPCVRLGKKAFFCCAFRKAPDDNALAEAEKAKLVGEWNLDGIDEIGLSFNEDGTGAYHFLTEKTITFTYFVYVSHREYANGAPYDDYLLKMSYDNGEVEDILFFFNDETGHLAFHNSEHGGYNGVIDYAEWTRKA